MAATTSAATNPLTAHYLALKEAARTDLRGSTTGRRLLDLVLVSLHFLAAQCQRSDLVSRVVGKTYSAYVRSDAPNLRSRPTNDALFVADPEWVRAGWEAWSAVSLSVDEIQKLCYTVATSYSVASDLFDRNNKKGPATYFEILIGHLFARELDVNPTNRARLPIVISAEPPRMRVVQMTMDFLFDVGPSHPKLHVPVKLSTRERVVQAWSHQRMLDAAFPNQYRAVLVVHSETKLDSRSREVVEICVPDQWLAYQRLLAKMDRIYFFDMPDRYGALTRDFPDIPVKRFAEFFTEREEVLLAALA